ncbi:hypothetical protein PYCCODRAFT_1437709 [Trametes coccinea BRFM310]|uniref:Secreted protein n=1 Tax=Trametes coccinea (strain BRFM310) TaxID=1353009 RepID=A0A1Y2IIT7_TRAC3|nr:hypothetical protein PYCCODRAFT_1437709 [Trametes coccinea BRFM310]
MLLLFCCSFPSSGPGLSCALLLLLPPVVSVEFIVASSAGSPIFVLPRRPLADAQRSSLCDGQCCAASSTIWAIQSIKFFTPVSGVTAVTPDRTVKAAQLMSEILNLTPVIWLPG